MLKFWISAAIGMLSGAALVLTVLWPEWIEGLFHVSPDGGDGRAEWLISLALLSVFVISAITARIQWLRLKAA